MMIKSFHVATLAVAFLLSVNIHAKSSDHKHDHGHDHDHDHGSKGQEAHVHGLAELTLALEGNNLEISLDSPAANIVGFEHIARTDEQKQAVNKAKATLESAQQLFSFEGSSCKLQSAKADVSALMGHDKHNHKDKEKHQHKEKHDHGHKDKHDHKDTHSEVSANYRFSCSQGAKLTTISIDMIKAFPGIETLKVMWLTDSKQGAVDLTAGTNQVRLR